MQYLDLAIIALYIVSVLALGVWSGRDEKDENDYFLGGRSMPWLAVAISFYATTASALTYIGVPGAAFKGDFVYLQLAVGDLIGRFLIGFYLLPAYFKHNVTTVYQLLGDRFGPRSQDAGTVLFLITRVLASGVRLGACAIAFSVIFQVPLLTTIVVITTIAMAYTVAGGIKAVIWTDTLQFCLFVGGAFVALGVIWGQLPGGFSQFLEIGQTSGKFTIFHLGWDFNDPNNFVPGTIFGMLLTLAVQGTDQDMVQRLLTTKTLRESQKALFLTALMNIPMTLLFLSVGASLFAFYQVFPSEAVTELVTQNHCDYIFPHFMRTALAPGLRGFLMAGLLAAAMSSLDSALNALSSTAYVDLYRKYLKPDADSDHAVRTSRILSVVFAVVLAIAAWIFGRQDGILWVGFRIMGYTYGTLLGLFLLAVWTEDRGSDQGNVISIFVSIALVIYLTAEAPYGIAALAWPWAIAVGTGSTMLVAAMWKTPSLGDKK
jgi:SSS family transporter